MYLYSSFLFIFSVDEDMMIKIYLKRTFILLFFHCVKLIRVKADEANHVTSHARS